ncbi:MAG: hypothetical protein LUQ50_13405 [Methanospirillum sp.]|uniref:hypothetical protein n=1 Tax=Methanospirillum sp. TaxID=45200 RepID=UPI0023719C22|nr:hypothetical protein [Methanospirillum sp.]MDD1730052.1 hypothetical protein [Methanospirillum sp.]
MDMYQTFDRTRNYWQDLGSMSGSFVNSIPTFDKQLDSFFDRNSEAIIEEWGLVTDDDLRHIKLKLEFLSYEVSRLMVEKTGLEKRTAELRVAIEELETGT